MLFYDLDAFMHNPMEIFMLRHEGLQAMGDCRRHACNHFFIKRTRTLLPGLTYIKLLDIMVIPTAIVACCIRLGNFINQEIVGTVTTMPWGVIFGHIGNGSLPIPRHPAQLYEALIYACTYFILLFIWLKNKTLKPGTISGLFFILVFGGRFFN